MFVSAHLKVERANQHINALHQGLSEFFQTRPYRVISNYDAECGLYGLQVVATESLPPWVGIVIGDVVHNLRSALEHVASDIYVLANGGDESARKRSKFPMHQTRENLIDAIDKGEIKPAFPKVAEAIVDTIQPFEDGQKLIWTLGQLWNIDKHRLPLVTFGVAEVRNIAAYDETGSVLSGHTAVFDMSGFARIFATDSPITITDQGQPTFSVFFNEVGLLEGEPLIPTLVQMSQLTSEAIQTISTALEV
jgi:hypothetical protein